jgi:UDP-N-acetylmuramate dehydrogenase
MAIPSKLVGSLRSLRGVRLWEDAPLGPFTSIGTGGKAALLATVADTAALVDTLHALQSYEVPWVCLGAGSNFLVADAGYSGVVVKLGEGFQFVEGIPPAPLEPPAAATLVAGAAVPLARLAVLAGEAGLSGLEFACGIPGSVGGGIAMNAGAYGSSLADVVREVQLSTASGSEWTAMSGLECGYRYCNLPTGSVVTAARFELVAGDCKAILECHRSILLKRRAAQPQGARTFGSTFKNPAGKEAGAGRLVEKAGLKGVRRGGAEVSKVHANFLVNLGDATTADVLALMCQMREGVQRACGVVLEPEVRLIGCPFPWQESAADSPEPSQNDG